MRYFNRNPNDFEPEFNATDSLADDLECGYANEEALDIINNLGSEDIQRLAAMALTWYASEWSDRDRDLLRGIYSVTRIPPSR